MLGNFGFLFVIKEQLFCSSRAESMNAGHALSYTEESPERLFLLRKADDMLLSLVGRSEDTGQCFSACEFFLF